MIKNIESVIREVHSIEYQIINKIVVKKPKAQEFLKLWKLRKVGSDELNTNYLVMAEPKDGDISYYDYTEFVYNQAFIGNLSIDAIEDNFNQLFV